MLCDAMLTPLTSKVYFCSASILCLSEGLLPTAVLCSRWYRAAYAARRRRASRGVQPRKAANPVIMHTRARHSIVRPAAEIRGRARSAAHEIDSTARKKVCKKQGAKRAGRQEPLRYGGRARGVEQVQTVPADRTDGAAAV
eukprot:COSAG02_NODE_1801_length_10895_cov_4.369767_10_plen_141_part_00